MADQVKYPGRLIAVDGSRGKDTAAAAAAVVEQLRRSGVECAISRWDASGLFGELASAARGDRNISMRTLALVYAADLAFRLRWEIRPVLEAGGVVVASPYIETVVAFGSSCGLSEDWTRQLMRFAPAPDVRGRAEERKVERPWKRRTDRGFAEYCAVMLDASTSTKVAKRARHEMMRMLEQARGRKVVTLTDKGIEVVAKSITGSRKDAPRRSASRPRSART
jgi:thymidylate kinase